MDFKIKYQELLNLPYDNNTIDKVKEFNNYCVESQNKEYYYLSNLLIVDNYTDLNKLDDALTILINDLTDFDSSTFKNIYISYLERIIYIYIKKRNFKIAYRYVFEKRKYIDSDNRDEINRWYLEMAYIYAEVGQKTKALNSLKAILENLPSDDLLAHTLSNITKLYIDQGLLDEAKESLNESLKIISDQEGLIYCNYLLAQILVKEGRLKDANQLYKEIFQNGISLDLITIAIDYVDLLIELNDYTSAFEVINKLKPLLKDNESIEIKKNLTIKEIKLLLSRSNYKEGLKLIDKLHELDEIISSNELYVINEILDEESAHEGYLNLNELNNKIIHLIGSLKSVFDQNDLRDVLMEFSKKLQKIFNIDEISYGIYDKIIATQKYDQIAFYNYKNNRIYEKLISYDELKDSEIEMMLKTNNEVAIDFTYNKLLVNDVFTQRKFIDNGFNYLLGIPFFDETGLYLSITYKSKNIDVTATENSIILKIASSLLERSLVSYFLTKKIIIDDIVKKSILSGTNNYIIYHYGNKMVIDNNFKELLGFESNHFDSKRYTDLMSKSDSFNYLKVDFNSENSYSLDYAIKIKDEFYSVTEKIISNYQDGELFFVGTIHINEKNSNVYDDEIFIKKIEDYKSRVNDLEFKFSLIRIAGEVGDSNYIENTFNTKPYFLSDGDYIIILENEVNQKVLDKYFNGFRLNHSVVRFPRDMINIDEMIKYSKVSLDNNIEYFSEEIHHKFLQKISANNIVRDMVKSNIEILLNEVIDKTKAFEVTCNIKGLSFKENIRKILEEDNLVMLENKIYDNFKPKLKNNLFYIFMTAKSLSNIIHNNRLKDDSNIIYVIDSFDSTLIESLNKLKSKGIKFIVDYKVLYHINIMDLNTLGLYGISISEGIQRDVRANILEISSTYNFKLYTNYNFIDYADCIYKTDKFIKDDDYVE